MTKRRFLQYLVLGSLLQICSVLPAYADFVNGGFEDTYTPTGSNSYDTITGWTITGYTFEAGSSTSPTSLSDINLTSASTPGGIADIINGTAQTLYDYFLEGATPTPSLLLPVTGAQSASINLRSLNAPLTKAGTGFIAGWTRVGQQATALSQQITVQAGDVDPTDHKVHVRFKLAPVLQNPSHDVEEQPFFAIQLNNITTGRTGANPLYFQWNYSAQQGVPWQTLSVAGSNSGSTTSYQYTDWHAFDIAPGNAFIHVGDVIELVVLASGCSPGGHDGHVYLDDVHTYIPPTLWVNAVAPTSSTPGNNITYTYYYYNSGSAPVDNIQVVAQLPVQANPSSPPAESTTFVSVTNPTTGTGSPACSGTGPITCTMGTLQAGESGTFQLTVNVPSGWSIATGPVNNGDYPISGTGVSPLLGPLVQTNLVDASDLSNLIANVDGLPTTTSVGDSYSGTFTCANTATSTATGVAANASCSIANLPTGLEVTGCTISPSSAAWTEPSDLPSNETISCTVSGTPTESGSFVAVLTTDSADNSNSTENSASTTITVSGGSSAVDIPATSNGSPILNPAIVCCGRPILLGALPIPGHGPTVYQVTAHTGDVVCKLGQTQSQTYLRILGRSGSCTIVGTKNNVSSNPLTVSTP